MTARDGVGLDKLVVQAGALDLSSQYIVPIPLRLPASVVSERILRGRDAVCQSRWACVTAWGGAKHHA